MSNVIVAETILHQLGGPRFRAMTGARSFAGSSDSLSFNLPARFAKDGIKGVRIVLDPSDTYTMTFYAQTGAPTHAVRVVAEHADVYADDLQRVFTMATGLDTSMGRMQRAS